MDQLHHQLMLVVFCLAAAACGSDGRTSRAQAATPVDSVVSREEELARFRDGLVPPAGLAGGAPSREALVREFIGALQKRDTAALGKLAMTRAEFAFLYYPTNPEGQPPYNLSPGLMWFMLEGHSRRGLSNALEHRGSSSLRYLAYACVASVRQGDNTIWSRCMVRRRDAAGTIVSEMLFGAIIERGGQYKFVSYTNKL